jgi:hypothetical protein
MQERHNRREIEAGSSQVRRRGARVMTVTGLCDGKWRGGNGWGVE